MQSQQKLLTEIALYVIRAGGKRIRPGISLLSFRSVGGKDTDRIIKLATAFELIHSATLIHDDINDGADLRRGRMSAFRKYGFQPALIAGDFLFVKGFRLGGANETEEIVEIVADACTRMAESEILQSQFEHDTNTPLETYLTIINGKTARPIQASAQVGAYIGGAQEDMIAALGDFGLNIGYSFQIVDDILDITGKEAEIGKPRGMDVNEGKPSLPILLAMSNGCDAPRIRELFLKERKDEQEIEEIIEAIKASDALRTVS